MKSLKIAALLFILLFFSACAEKKKNTSTVSPEIKESQYMVSAEFRTILDSAKVKGAIVIYDLQKNSYYSNDFDWAETQRLPASTFKIPNSIIALETGVVENDSSLFKWNGAPRALKVWERDFIFRDAFHFSCVPCYQAIARKIGVKRMLGHLAELGYGEMSVDSSNIDTFWLVGDSKISPLQQIDFLRRLYESKLPISDRTESIMKEMMIVDKKEDYSLSGKTGLAVRDEGNNGWFVGFVETSGKIYFFATNMEPLNGFNMQQFLTSRKEVTFSALRQMGVIK